MTTWEYASSRLGDVSDKTYKIAHEIWHAAQAAGHDVWFMWGDGPDPDHNRNRQGLPVLDFMVRNEAGGDFVRNYSWEHRARHGLKHTIWEQHITSTVVEPGVRRKMANRGNPTANHYDHVHNEWFGGGYVPLGPVAPAPPVPVDPFPLLKMGAKGPVVEKLQRFFANNFPGYRPYVNVQRGKMIQVDGDFGPQTQAWVIEFQRRTEIARDGEVGPRTWSKLRAHGYK